MHTLLVFNSTFNASTITNHIRISNNTPRLETMSSQCAAISLCPFPSLIRITRRFSRRASSKNTGGSHQVFFSSSAPSMVLTAMNRRGIRSRRRFLGLQIPCLVLVRLPIPSHSLSYQLHCREKGESSKAKDYLPADRQYLVTRGGRYSESNEDRALRKHLD